MKEKVKTIAYNIIGFILIGIISFALFKLIYLFIGKLDKINANVIVALLAGSFTITGYFITRYLEKKKVIEQQIREQKLPIYEEFIDFIFRVINPKNINNENKDLSNISQEEMEEFFWKFNKKSILWLTDNTLKSYIKWRINLIEFSQNKNTNKSNTHVLIDLEQLLLDFRKDIGHKNKVITSGDILSMFINDWKNYKSRNK